MPYLSSTQRSFLEKSVIAARKAAEAGAANALKALAVHHFEPYGSMEPEKRALRNRLRYKGRLLGDKQGIKGEQQIENLSSELAYEYWHKMLFAKFLEVNGLLMHPDGVPVSLQECEELASSEKFSDKWHAASVYASKMLPAIFRPEDPIMAVEFATEDRIKLESILESISDDIFIADDALGWVYQFWQSEAKDIINKSGDKIDGKKLPAVTQLFTEPYMVHFLIDNSIGAWWVSRNPGVTPPVEFKYLRLLENGTPAAGKFEGWPDKAKDVTSLDPCMGSGHFIVAQFDVFVKLRMYEEGLSKEEAAIAVIKENLHGLELDPRCTQIAAFNLALATWKFVEKYFLLPEMNLACSGLAPSGKKEDWINLASKIADPAKKVQIGNGLRELYELFQLASELGSLIDPHTIKPDVFTAGYHELQPELNKALEIGSEYEKNERTVMASGIAKAGKILSSKYSLIMTNVPFLGRKLMSECLRQHSESFFKLSKQDLATIFIERFQTITKKNGVISIICPHNWFSIKTYLPFRDYFLNNYNLKIVAHLGSGAFSQISGEVVNVVLLIASSGGEESKYGDFYGVDCTISSTVEEKIVLIKHNLYKLNQLEQHKNPDKRIILEKIETNNLLSDFANSIQGLVSGDNFRFTYYFWEIEKNMYDKVWRLIQSANLNSKLYNGFDRIINYHSNGDLLARNQGQSVWSRHGVAVNVTSNLFSSIYTGYPFTSDIATIIPFEEKFLLPIFEYCSSVTFYENVRKIDKKLGVTNATLIKVPFDYEYWQKVASEKYPNGLPKPYSDDPTQWLFHGHPVNSESPLQVTVARFLGYRWPAENDDEMELADEAKTLIKAIKEFNDLSDEDGIVCIPSVNGELEAAERIREYLSKIYGTEWAHDTLEKLLRQAAVKSTTLESWLRDEFFEQHYKLFNNRPFIWQIWDGRKDGFSALVNYHKLTKENLQKLIYTYLGDWIRQCELKVKNGESGADGLLLAANQLKTKLELILEGEKPYDIFVRWKKLEEQPIGWEPDINDGVRLNIRPFLAADVLRKKPNIKYGIDRGKNPPGSPWGEVRDNDKHLSLKEKLEAREKAGGAK